MFFNQSQAPVLADPIVRQALDMATDRSAIVKAVLYGYGLPAHSPLPASMGEDMGLSPASATDTADLAGATIAPAKERLEDGL